MVLQSENENEIHMNRPRLDRHTAAAVYGVLLLACLVLGLLVYDRCDESVGEYA